jgi:hypothetical protein
MEISCSGARVGRECCRRSGSCLTSTARIGATQNLEYISCYDDTFCNPSFSDFWNRPPVRRVRGAAGHDRRLRRRSQRANYRRSSDEQRPKNSCHNRSRTVIERSGGQGRRALEAAGNDPQKLLTLAGYAEKNGANPKSTPASRMLIDDGALQPVNECQNCLSQSHGCFRSMRRAQLTA